MDGWLRSFVSTIKPVSAGDQLCWNYGPGYADSHGRKVGCLCGATDPNGNSKCLGVIGAPSKAVDFKAYALQSIKDDTFPSASRDAAIAENRLLKLQLHELSEQIKGNTGLSEQADGTVTGRMMQDWIIAFDRDSKPINCCDLKDCREKSRAIRHFIRKHADAAIDLFILEKNTVRTNARGFSVTVKLTPCYESEFKGRDLSKLQ